MKLILFLTILIALLSIYFGIYSNISSIVTLIKSFFTNNLESNNVDQIKTFTIDQLKQYNGNNKEELYLSILGNVYDVTKASKHYGPGQSYHAFIGKDASKSFITGNFDDDHISDDIRDLKPDELLSLKDWKSFYDKEYTKKGILIGRYYDHNGKSTQYSEMIQNLVQHAQNSKDNKQFDAQLYPPCNIEWNAETGTRVWCTKQSGGINRNWVGFPRKYYTAGAATSRCACVNDVDDPKLGQYENCDPDAISCHIKVD